jgi:hypothetical protein
MSSSSSSSSSSNDEKKQPEDEYIDYSEIDTHYQIYGKHAWEVEYGGRCSICNKRIDEFGFCACGSVQ